jgi:hypothetical protein
VYATVSRSEARTPPRQAVRSATAKLIRNVADGSYELYDLVADPHERHELGLGAPGGAELLRQLDARRAQIATTGDHLRLRSASARPVAYTVTIAGETPLAIVEPDRLTLEDGDRILVHEKARGLTLTGTLEPGGEDHIRMEILESTGLLAITVLLDDAPAPFGTVRLGPAATQASGAHIDLAAATLVGEPRTLPADAPPVTAAFWRVAGGAAEAGGPDAATRERLRTLGYAE